MKNRKYKIGISIAIASLILLISYAAFSTGSLNTRQPQNTPITIRAETDKSTYAIGEVVQIRLYFVNAMPNAFKTGALNLGYEVLNSKDKEIYSIGANLDYSVESPFTLPAQSETLFSQTFKWPQLSFTIQNSTRVTSNVTPGTYIIRVIVFEPFQATTETTVVIEE